MAASEELQDAQLVNAVEVAFEEIRVEETKKRSPGAAAEPPETRGEDAIKKQVARMLALDESFEASSQTMRRVQGLSEQAGIVFVRARDYLEYLKVSVEDRASRDAALLQATVEYVRQRSVVDTRRMLAAAADATRPLVLLAAAASDPAKRSNLTLSEGLLLLQSGVSPLQSTRRLETFRFNDLDAGPRADASYRRKLLADPKLPLSLPEGRGAAGATATVVSAAAATAAALPFGAAAATTAASDLAWRAQRVAAQAPGAAARDQVSRLLPPGLLLQGVLGFFDRAEPPAALSQAAALSAAAAPPLEVPERATAARQQDERERASAEQAILDWELSGVTVAAAAAVAATEMANEEETLGRLRAAVAGVRPVAKAWALNATREATALKGLTAVLATTTQVSWPAACHSLSLSLWLHVLSRSAHSLRAHSPRCGRNCKRRWRSGRRWSLALKRFWRSRGAWSTKWRRPRHGCGRRRPPPRAFRRGRRA
jgi:hypothetical protein